MFTAVIDTNVFVNALLNGSCRPIIEAIIEKKFLPATSAPLLRELMEVCSRPKFRSRIPKEDRERLLAIIKEAAKTVSPKNKITACRDKDDNIILECAIAANAHLIVTTDPDLLALNPFRSASIIPPREFLARL